MAFHQQNNCCSNLSMEVKVNLTLLVSVRLVFMSMSWGRIFFSFQCHHVVRISGCGFI